MRITVTYGERRISAATGQTLGSVLRGAGIALDMPCGGKGRCGKCRVTATGALGPLSDMERQALTGEEITAGVRLACQAVLLGDASVSQQQQEAVRILSDGAAAGFRVTPEDGRGVAIDIGTTTVAAALYDLRDGRRLDVRTAHNPQAAYGADVISRIEAALNGELEPLCRAIRGLLAQMLCALCPDASALRRIVIVGNTTMLYLLCNSSPRSIAFAPFLSDRLFGERVPASSLDLPFDAPVWLGRSISAFVGADTTAALLAAVLTEGQVLMDIGTNGEIAGILRGEMCVCSTAAGPVFEGAGISCGMQAAAGAIDRVGIMDGQPVCHTIDGAAAKGICGSGLISAVAALLELGAVDETGALNGEHPLVCGDAVTLCPGVRLTKQDVRMLQLAKSAICSGLETLLHRQDRRPADVRTLLIAGGFGSSLDPQAAERIGLIPSGCAGKVRFIGNAALSGAAMLLCDRDQTAAAMQLAQRAQTAELSSDPYFSDRFIDNMLFPDVV